MGDGDNVTTQPGGEEDNDLLHGDKIYLSLGLTPIGAVRSTMYMVPPVSEGPYIAGYRVEIEFPGDEPPFRAVFPLDELLTLTSALIDCTSPEKLTNSGKKIATLNYSKKKLTRLLDESEKKLSELRAVIDEVVDDDEETE